jgi:hypothetical protein
MSATNTSHDAPAGVADDEVRASAEHEQALAAADDLAQLARRLDTHEPARRAAEAERRVR